MSDRKQKLANEIATFLRQYGRKRKNTPDPNDRQYDRKLKQQIKRMRPEDLDELMNDDFE